LPGLLARFLLFAMLAALDAPLAVAQRRPEPGAAGIEAARDGGISAATRRRLRVAAINAVERCTRAVDLCFAAGGGSSIHDGCVLQRVFCDMHTASQHGINSTLFSETLGRIAMGVPADTGLL
jgi:alkylation response protein AidB-like acyl-CoA dehydrogenase